MGGGHAPGEACPASPAPAAMFQQRVLGSRGAPYSRPNWKVLTTRRRLPIVRDVSMSESSSSVMRIAPWFALRKGPRRAPASAANLLASSRALRVASSSRIG